MAQNKQQNNRTIEGYEIIHSIQLDDGEVIFADNPAADARYMVCDCAWDNPFGVDIHSNAVGSADYFEMMKEFAHRLSGRVAAIAAEREARGIPFQTLTADDCQPVKDVDLEGRVVVLNPQSLAPEFRSSIIRSRSAQGDSAPARPPEGARCSART
ncbi:MAG: hypothetical protein LBS10_04675 [Gracilibacteraceae bacterium]|jgi:hypothetical protein|nr:hypothetical protein [Gracilibacteraceae bacterium]